MIEFIEIRFLYKSLRALPFLLFIKVLAILVNNIMQRVINYYPFNIKRRWGGTISFNKQRACVLFKNP